MGEVAGDCRGNGSETCDGGNQENLADSAPFQSCICSVVVDPKGPLDLSLKKKQIGAKYEGSDRAHHVLDKLPKPPSPGLAVLEIEEDFANKLLDLGTNVGHLSSSQSVECGRRLQSGVCKEPVGSAHQVFDYLPQGNAEGKGQVRAAVSSPRTWANIVASDSTSRKFPGGSKLNHRSSSGSCLEFFAPQTPGFIDIDNVLINDQPWENCLVGHFLEDNFAFGRVRAMAMSHWRNEGLQEVFGNDSGFFFFKFRSTLDMDNVIEKGPWHFFGKLLILRKWRKRIRLSKESFFRILVWVKFLDLPLEFWNDDCLSRIASAVGIPLFLDKATDLKLRISFARICIEIDAAKPLIHSVFVRCEGETVEIPIEYQGLPPLCEICKAFGHETVNCKDFASIGGHVDCKEEEACEAIEMDSAEGSSDSAEWIRVGKRRSVIKDRSRGKRPMVQGSRPNHLQSRPRVTSVSQPFSKDPGHRFARPFAQQFSIASDQVGAQPSRSAPPALSTCCADPPRSPAALASLRLQAIDGSGIKGASLL